MSKFRLSRRAVLRGLVGGTVTALALPPLEAMFNQHGDALASGESIPKRFGVFFWGNGVRLARWTPSQTGAGWTPSEALAPLSAVKDYVSVLSGMNVKIPARRGHHNGAASLLSGIPFIEENPGAAAYASTFGGPSIDQIAAEAIGQSTRFRSLEVGVSKRVSTSEGTTLQFLSHNGPNNTNPPEYSPRALFQRVFGSGFDPGDPSPEVDPRVALRRSVLDAVINDADDLKTRLGSNDKARLDQHLDGVRDLEQRLAKLEELPTAPSACVTPAEPPELPNVNGNEQLTAISHAMSDVLAMAIACDQTRVFSNMFSGSVSYTVYNEIGATDGHHSLTHDEPGEQDMVHDITVYIIDQLAYFLSALKAIPEGAGNVLDNLSLVATTDVTEGKIHSETDYPILIAGGGGGSLKSPGIHYRSTSGENTSKAIFTALRAAGVPLTEFGEEEGRVTSGISAIEV